MESSKDTTNDGSYIQPIPCKNKEVYSELNSLIYEYLEVNGLEQALRTFSKECQLKNLPCPQAGSEEEKQLMKAAFTHYDGQQLLRSFDEGDLDSFLKLWEQFKTHIQVTSEDLKKLEVYLRVHFAVWPKAKELPEAKQLQAMQQLKTFFEQHSESLSSDATILPLFALPYVSDPRPHPIFKDLFQDSWTLKLRAQLETTVNKYFELLQENITIHCKLAAVIVKSKSKLQQGQVNSVPCTVVREPEPASSKPSSRSMSQSGSQQFAVQKASASGTSVTSGVSGEADSKVVESLVCYHKVRFFQLMAIYKKQRKVLRGVRENCGRLLKVCATLLNSLENPGEPLPQVIQQCYMIYPDIFTTPASPSGTAIPFSAGNKQPDIEHFKTLAASASATMFNADVSDVGLLFVGIQDISLDNLNYDRIKTDLSSERLAPTEKLCLLQALRWLITKTAPVARSQVMLHFSENDLLGLDADTDTVRSKLFSSLLSPTPTYHKESLSRLMNAFASTWAFYSTGAYSTQ